MTDPTRRSFLHSLAGAGLALPLAATAAAAATRSATSPWRTAPRHGPQRILVLGGTGFLGPHFVRSALTKGHTVTLFHRGKTGVDLFKDLEHLKGDREKGDLDALRGREFDAIIDTSGYVPAHVDATAKLFAKIAQHYQFISSVSVYRSFGESPADVDENAEVAEVEDDKVAAVSTIRQSMPFYGALKARCENAAKAAMGDKVAVLRPGLIVGPGDNSDRFTWWPVRVDRGGEVLAPGDPDGVVQAIDARDLADFMVHALEARLAGTYNAVGFAGAVSMQDLLAGCKCATSKPVTFTWVAEDFLLGNDVGPWMEMPLWIPKGNRGRIVNKKAIDAGLVFRPLGDTIRDTLQWAKTERGDRPFDRTGLKPEKETALLAKWHAQQK